MGRRGLFVLFNVFISAVVAFGIMSTFSPESDSGTSGPERLVTFIVQITSTSNPNPATPWIITATPLPGEQAVAVIPNEVRDGTTIPSEPVATIDPVILNEGGDLLAQNLPEGCITHTIQDGEFPSLIATTYDVSLPELLLVNDLTEEESFLLQIGEILVVPIEGCPIEAFIQNTEAAPEEVVEEDSTEVAADENNADTTEGEATEEPTPEITPTITLAPTATNAQVEITEVIGAGDITTESVTIRNNGSVIDISGWTLSDGDNNTFVFPEGRRLFSGGEIIINTRIGENTTILFFWGRDQAAFGEIGDVITLADREGTVQASLRITPQ